MIDVVRKDKSHWLIVYALCAICLVGGALFGVEIKAGSSRLLMDEQNTNPPAFASPISVAVNVRAVLDIPTETPVPTPTAKPASSSGSAPTKTSLDFCGVAVLNEGDVCRMPMPTPTVTPTLPTCYSPEALDGGLCVIRFTPTPVPTATPVPTLMPGPTSEIIPTLSLED